MNQQTPSQTLLPSQRAQFDIPADVAYLNSAYMGPMPTVAVAAGERGMRAKLNPWTIAPVDFFTESETVRGLFAKLVNATADDVALVPSVSYGMAVAANILALKKGQSVLTLAEQFPSNVYPWIEKAKAVEATFISIPRPSDDDWTARVLERIDANTGIVALPHCHWTDGGLLDLITIGAACRKVGAALCIDATQSMGVMPFDVQAIQPDFLVAGGYKWLLGPYTYGYLYVAKRWHGGMPIEQNWIARKDSENFAGLVDYKSDYQPGARRFDVGERSNFALAPAAHAALDYLLGLGTQRIYATLKHRNDAIAERARAELGLDTVRADRRAGHYLGLRFDGAVPADLPAKLAAEKVFVSVRGQAMRVTPHVYNTEDDIEKLFKVLKAAL
ncbi:aminotransferase class V-fold PLP-dependent enzyme [Ferrovibrio terrae]|uniref:Aminotransferase class V-fold PLP-dependent enzyme n=1 Tax=Ferrovibrio terrae TaxID=2594003 RepID=A0A516GZ11_9PROT|nr:aminotransferase class V-fold PLP-dependent enzyme [Ferrovibrio terrae]QDO96756.1 aminotransferase class V-fold PLP-dependent enzyme [Ferrovibrio terrae]